MTSPKNNNNKDNHRQFENLKARRMATLRLQSALNHHTLLSFVQVSVGFEIAKSDYVFCIILNNIKGEYIFAKYDKIYAIYACYSNKFRYPQNAKNSHKTSNKHHICIHLRIKFYN